MNFESAEEDALDSSLATKAASGDKAALADLLRRHQQWVFGLALRMTREPALAADLAQEALLRVVTRIAQFEGRSGFRTWAYTIVVRTLLNARRDATREVLGGFEDYGRFIDELGMSDDTAGLAPQEWAYAVEETKVRCMLGMLLCLDREQRLVLILGGILALPSECCAEILESTPAAFRKRLERARSDLRTFMEARCGLVNPENPCRCPKKTAALIARGFVDPARLRFAGPSVDSLTDEAPSRSKAFEEWAGDASVDAIRRLPVLRGPDVAGALQQLLGEAGFDLPS